MKRFLTNTKGFTIVELLISMTVFIILLGIVVGIFIQALRKHQGLVALMAANDNVSLALEQMARELRTSFEFSILTAGPPIPNGTAIKFRNARDEIVSYNLISNVLGNDAIARGVCDDPVSADCNDANDFEYFEITSTSVVVNGLSFYLVHVDPTVLPGIWPPRIVITTDVSPKALPDFSTNIQTTVSGRNLE